MSDILGRHTNKCDYCDKRGYCPQCKGKGFVIEELDEQIKGIRKGDILLIQHRFDPVGWVIRYFTHCQYNHVAWFTNDKELIELKAIGKRKALLSHYLNKWLYKCKAIRIKNILPCKINEAIRRAKKAQFNYSYLSWLLNCILIKLKITKELPRLSCSGFIGSFLAQVGFHFCDKNPEFITPKDIELSKKGVNVSEELYL